MLEISEKFMAIKLEKSGDSHKINLEKSQSIESLRVHVNLDWEELKKKEGGFLQQLFGSKSSPDLDLGCMYEMTNGQKGVIQPLGGNFGSKIASPYIFLDKDDRTGSSTDGENMYLFRPDLIKRVMFFSFIYEGADDFQSVRGRMFFKISNGEEVYLELNNPDGNRSFCAAALIENINSQITIVKEEKYFSDHQGADAHYGFNFRWQYGSK